MRHLQAVILALVGTPSLSAHAQSGELYQWKDANGITHYSQTPPERGQYQHRVMNQRGTTAPAPAQATAQAAQENPQCTTARANLATLRSNDAVHEADADGNPGRVLSDTERANQIELANAAIKAYCKAD